MMRPSAGRRKARRPPGQPRSRRAPKCYKLSADLKPKSEEPKGREKDVQRTDQRARNLQARPRARARERGDVAEVLEAASLRRVEGLADAAALEPDLPRTGRARAARGLDGRALNRPTRHTARGLARDNQRRRDEPRPDAP